MKDQWREARGKMSKRTATADASAGPAAASAPVPTSSAPTPTGGAPGLQGRVLEQLGMAICGGSLHPGEVLRSDALEERYHVSRSVIREALSILGSMGLVESRRRVGVTIQPATAWNLYDPLVIRWRLATNGRLKQLRSLTELRSAVEPQAARLAAQRAPLSGASDLVGLAAKMWAAGQAGNSEEFLALDIEFHRLVLQSSGNEMFAKLDSLVAEVLAGRTQYGLMPHHPSDEALQLHADVASAVQRRKPDEAHAAMLHIMQQAIEEMSSLWAQDHPGEPLPAE